MTSTDYYRLLGAEQGRAALKETVERQGYDAFRLLVDRLEQELKAVDESGFDALSERLAAGRRLFPEPVRFSPAWQRVWEDLSAKLRWKRYAFECVPAGEREGEWQIVMDNPFTNHEVICYPTLSFVEAAYLFGYFKPSLENNEYLRLQKIVNTVVVTGRSAGE